MGASSVITVRVPKELKEKMKRLKVNWSEEIRNYLERRVQEYEFLEVLEEVRGRARRRKVATDSVTIIRRDRER